MKVTWLVAPAAAAVQAKAFMPRTCAMSDVGWRTTAITSAVPISPTARHIRYWNASLPAAPRMHRTPKLNTSPAATTCAQPTR